MGLFKRAAARGIAHELVRTGVCSFPSKYAMDGAADAVADASPGLPEMSPPEGHDPEHVAAVANKLIQIAQELMQSAGPSGPPGAEDVAKMSSANDYDTLAYNVALECMDKAAAETKQASGLMRGGDKGNTPAEAASTSEVADLDKKQRPQGKYLVGAGNTSHGSGADDVGHLTKQPLQPSQTVSGNNSVNSLNKRANYEAIIAKYASGLMRGGDAGNTPAQAVATSEVAELDQKQRPQGKYLVGAGKTEHGAGHDDVGHLTKHPLQPSQSISGTNSVNKLSSDEQAYLNLFSKTAADVGPFLPASLSEAEKVSALQRMVPMDHAGRQAELDAIYKTASGLPEALKAMKEEKKDDGKKDDGKKDEGEKREEKMTEPEAKKESSLLAQIRSIASQAR